MLLLALVLCISFVPLYFAVSTYTKTAHSVAQRQLAVALAEGTALTVRRQSIETEADLQRLLTERITTLRYVDGPQLTLEVGVPASPTSPPHSPMSPDGASVHTTVAGTWVGLELSAGAELWVLVSDQPILLERLNMLLLAYMAIAAGVLLAGVYFIVTHRIIRPLDELSHAARRVTATERPLLLPDARSREFQELNTSLQVMTDRLLREEEALRGKVAEIETRTQQLRSAQAQLVRSERLASVGQLAAGVAHEIGNPIAALMGLQDLILQGGMPPEDQEEFVRRMRKETERIHRIVRDLLHFSRPKPAEALGNATASLAVALEETLGLLKPQPAFRELTVEVDVAPDVARVAAPEETLVQIFLNLLINAAAACGAEGHVVVGAKPWCAPAEPAPMFVEVVVQDDGPGVPPQLRDSLFEPFVSGKDVGEGTGLGLSVCRNLVDAIATATGSPHVAIELDHTFTAGARFVLRLPIARS